MQHFHDVPLRAKSGNGAESDPTVPLTPARVKGRPPAEVRERLRIAELAPGFRDLVLDRRVLGPVELERRNENLVGGAVNGGTAAIHQQLFWRPVPGLGRAETPIQGLYLASASAHPGGGVHGACGSNAARAALLHDRLRSAQRRLIPVSNRRSG